MVEITASQTDTPMVCDPYDQYQSEVNEKAKVSTIYIIRDYASTKSH